MGQKIGQIAQKYSDRKLIFRLWHEMNGCWYYYGCQPDAFKSAWNQVLDASGRPPNVAFAWAPNAGNVGDGPDFYSNYWPDNNHLPDIVATSIYWKDEQNGINAPYQPQRDPINAVQVLHDHFSAGYGIPFFYAETAYGFLQGLGGDDFTVKTQWYRRLYSADAKKALPMLKGIMWFEYLKYEDNYNKDFRLLYDGNIASQFAQDLKSYGLPLDLGYDSTPPPPATTNQAPSTAPSSTDASSITTVVSSSTSVVTSVNGTLLTITAPVNATSTSGHPKATSTSSTHTRAYPSTWPTSLPTNAVPLNLRNHCWAKNRQ
ncbi:glycoside hydrolase superfamily [Zopfochytrium polystomum]|nr:glycoside hydrolase superfamily [Zopfochytrium polystomum]